MLASSINIRKFPSVILKLLPFLQIIRCLRIDRQCSSWKILKCTIITTHCQELTVTLVIGFMFLITCSYLIYVIEMPIDPNLKVGLFKSLADTM